MGNNNNSSKLNDTNNCIPSKQGVVNNSISSPPCVVVESSDSETEPADSDSLQQNAITIRAGGGSGELLSSLLLQQQQAMQKLHKIARVTGGDCEVEMLVISGRQYEIVRVAEGRWISRNEYELQRALSVLGEEGQFTQDNHVSSSGKNGGAVTGGSPSSMMILPAVDEASIKENNAVCVNVKSVTQGEKNELGTSPLEGINRKRKSDISVDESLDDSAAKKIRDDGDLLKSVVRDEDNLNGLTDNGDEGEMVIDNDGDEGEMVIDESADIGDENSGNNNTAVVFEDLDKTGEDMITQQLHAGPQTVAENTQQQQVCPQTVAEKRDLLKNSVLIDKLDKLPVCGENNSMINDKDTNNITFEKTEDKTVKVTVIANDNDGCNETEITGTVKEYLSDVDAFRSLEGTEETDKGTLDLSTKLTEGTDSDDSNILKTLLQ